MANEQHIEWLLEGVEAWNARREREDFVPNLAGVNLYKSFMRRESSTAMGKFLSLGSISVPVPILLKPTRSVPI